MVLPRVDGVVSVSANTLQAVGELYRLAVPTMCIPCAVDPSVVTPSVGRPIVRRQVNTPLDAPVIVWVGSLTPEKRLDRLLRAAALVRRDMPELHVWIVGDGPLRQEMEAQVRASPLAQSVRFLGVQNQVANYMSAGDLVALTSESEGMPAVLLEAGLLGLPVVATRVGGVSECVLDGQTGILVQRNDEDGLANALRSLLQRPQQRCRLGAAARAWVERNFTMSRVAHQYAEFYRQVLTG
jgi:glycosyltransferase involved in cell wall biosynthesis